MKFLTKKGFWNKLIVILFVIIVFNVIVPTHKVQAYDVGGALLKPVNTLVLKLADGVVDMIHKVIFGTSTALLEYDTTSILGWVILFIIGALLIAAVAALAAFVLPAGVAALGQLATGLGLTGVAALTSASTIAIGTIIKITVGGTAIAGMYLYSSWFGDLAVFPIYQISPEEIFRNEIGLLNANFFNTYSGTTNSSASSAQETLNQLMHKEPTEFFDSLNHFVQDFEVSENNTEEQVESNIEDVNAELNAGIVRILQCDPPEFIDIRNYSEYWSTVGQDKSIMIMKATSKDGKTFDIELKINRDDDDRIWFVVNFYDISAYVGSVEASEPIANTLKPTVARWYYALRNLSLVLMMTELVYIGIRIMLCSVASEKAKYKNMLKDWVVAICLLFVMHYIMAFANNIVDAFINIINTLSGDHEYIVYVDDEDDKIKKQIKNDLGVDVKTNEENPKVIEWNAGNIMGLARMQAQIQGKDVTGVWYLGYTIAFIVLVLYTVFFLFTYLKRLIYLAFLTIIAPLVAFTYPIDKINDGKAQAFDMWFKEYIFNLLIQPFHLILYTVLITSAFELASENIIYTLVAMGFMMPAEKLLRKFFGFEKAQTPGLLGGAAGAAIVMSGMNKLLHGRPPKHSNSGNSENGKIKENENLDEITSSDGIDNSELFNKDDAKAINTGVKEKQGEDAPKSNLILPGQLTPEEEEIRKKQSEILRKTAEEAAKKETGKPNGVSKPSTSRKLDLSRAKRPIPKQNVFDRMKSRVANSRRIRGIKGAAKSYLDQKLTRAIKGGGKFISNIPRMATGAALGVGAGMVGISAGIVSGDLGKVAQYGGASIAGGYALGSSFSDSLGGLVSEDEEQLKREYERAYYGTEEEYKKAKLEEKRQKYISNEAHIREMQYYLSCDENTARQKLEEYGDCIDVGITDTKDIAAISKAVDNGWSRKKAMTAAKTLKKAGGEAPGKMGKKAREDWDYKAANIVKNAGATDVDKAVKQTNDTLDQFVAFKDDLTSIKN